MTSDIHKIGMPLVFTLLILTSSTASSPGRAYLRDLFCLIHSWPAKRYLELAPAFWKQTLQHEDAQQILAANVFRPVTLVEHVPPT